MPRGDPAGYLPNVVAKRRASRGKSVSTAARSTARRKAATRFGATRPTSPGRRTRGAVANPRAFTRANRQAAFKR